MPELSIPDSAKSRGRREQAFIRKSELRGSVGTTADLRGPVATSALHQISAKKAYTINEFCALHSITRRYYYKLKKQGKAPRLMAGNRISEEAAADWRRAMEATADLTTA